MRMPTDIDAYMEKSRFLPVLNNERPEQRNPIFKERFSSLQNLVLIKFEQDSLVVPAETTWFGFYADGCFDRILPPQQTKLYIEDWIGLRSLDEAGRVHFISVPGLHMALTESEMKQYVVPYLNNQLLQGEEVHNKTLSIKG